MLLPYTVFYHNISGEGTAMFYTAMPFDNKQLNTISSPAILVCNKENKLLRWYNNYRPVLKEWIEGKEFTPHHYYYDVVNNQYTELDEFRRAVAVAGFGDKPRSLGSWRV